MKSESPLYSSLATAIDAAMQPGYHPDNPPNVALMIPVFEKFSRDLRLPVDTSGSPHSYSFSANDLFRWHGLCDPSTVEAMRIPVLDRRGNPTNSMKDNVVDACMSVLQHIESDFKEADNADLIDPQYQAHEPPTFRLLADLLVSANVNLVKEAVKASEDIEHLKRNDINDDIDVLVNGTSRTRLDAISIIAAQQNNGIDGGVPVDEFVERLKTLQAAGYNDLVKRVLDQEVHQDTGEFYTLEEAEAERQEREGTDPDEDVL